MAVVANSTRHTNGIWSRVENSRCKTGCEVKGYGYWQRGRLLQDLSAPRAKQPCFFAVFELALKVAVTTRPGPYQVPANALLIAGFQEFGTAAGKVQCQPLRQVAFDKTQVVLRMVQLLFKVDEVNHKKSFRCFKNPFSQKKKGKKKAAKQAAARRKAKRKRNK